MMMMMMMMMIIIIIINQASINDKRKCFFFLPKYMFLMLVPGPDRMTEIQHSTRKNLYSTGRAREHGFYGAFIISSETNNSDTAIK